MNCAECGKEMEPGFVYVRGMGGSLFWSTDGDVRFPSKRGLEQLDLSKLSTTSIGAQAVVSASRCTQCGVVSFQYK